MTIELITTISDNNKCFLQSSESVRWEILGATYTLTFEMRLVVLQNGFLSLNVRAY